MKNSRSTGRALIISLAAVSALLVGATSAVFGVCGPFTDVSDAAFCPFVLEIFTLGITTGTSPTTYAPTDNVNRLQMAAFLSRSVDGVLKRGSRRAALNQYWTPQNTGVIGLTPVGQTPTLLTSDGADIWVSNTGDGTISRVRASDAKLLETWTGAFSALGVVAAMGRIVIEAASNPGKVYRIDPSQPAGAVTTVATNLGDTPDSMTFDGARFWTANFAEGVRAGSVSIVTPGSIPWTVTNVTAGFANPGSVLFDGTNVWATDTTARTLLKLNASGAILQTVTVGVSPSFAVFDGTNIWVPNNGSASVSVVRASSGAVLATLTGNGATAPGVAAFDGQRVLVTNATSNNVSLWKAADLTPLGSFPTGLNSNPYGACSDGVNFWIALAYVGLSNGQLARF